MNRRSGVSQWLALGALTLALLASGLVSSAAIAGPRRVGQVLELRNTPASRASAGEPKEDGALQPLVRALPDLYLEPIPLPDPLIQALRWSIPSPSQVRCPIQLEEGLKELKALAKPVEGAPQASPVGADALVTALNEAAGVRLLHVELEQAEGLLKQARGLLGCLQSPMDKGVLRSIFVREAAVLSYLGKPEADAAFARLIAIDPRLYLEPEYSSKVRKQFNAVAQKLLLDAPVWLDITGMEGAIWVDGSPAPSGVAVHPGLHLLQLVGPDGRVRSGVFTLSKSDPRPFPLKGRVEVGLLSTEEVMRMLRAAVAAERLDAELQSGLESYMKGASLQALAFIADSPDSAPPKSDPMLRAYQVGRGFVPLSEAGKLLKEGDITRLPKRLFYATVELRGGAGLTLGGIESYPSAHSELGLFAEVSVLRLGLVLHEAFDLTRAGVFPRMMPGVLAGPLLRLSPSWLLAPAVGYGFGDGPTVAVGDCGVSEDGQSVLCAEGQGTSTLWLSSQVHGPLLRLESHWRKENPRGTRRMAASVGLQAEYALSTIIPPASVSLSSGDTLPVQLESVGDLHPLRLEALLGLQLIF